jgi:hypothetical protein
MSELSRRALVTSTATLPALAMPSLASAANNPDAELLRLGTELEAVEQTWLKQTAVDDACGAAYEAACIHAGLPRIAFPETADEEGRQSWLAYQKKRQSIPYPGDEEAESTWEEIQDRMFGLIDEIFSRKPSTVAGITVLVRAAVMDSTELWAPGLGERDTKKRLLLESLCSFLDIVPAALRRAA